MPGDFTRYLAGVYIITCLSELGVGSGKQHKEGPSVPQKGMNWRMLRPRDSFQCYFFLILTSLSNRFFVLSIKVVTFVLLRRIRTKCNAIYSDVKSYLLRLSYHGHPRPPLAGITPSNHLSESVEFPAVLQASLEYYLQNSCEVFSSYNSLEEDQNITALYKLQLSFEKMIILPYTKEHSLVHDFLSQTSVNSHVPKQKAVSDCYVNVCVDPTSYLLSFYCLYLCYLIHQ